MVALKRIPKYDMVLICAARSIRAIAVALLKEEQEENKEIIDSVADELAAAAAIIVGYIGERSKKCQACGELYHVELLDEGICPKCINENGELDGCN